MAAGGVVMTDYTRVSRRAKQSSICFQKTGKQKCSELSQSSVVNSCWAMTAATKEATTTFNPPRRAMKSND
jgi:hypothetical protein